jgi:hypothetical protein
MESLSTELMGPFMQTKGLPHWALFNYPAQVTLQFAGVRCSVILPASENRSTPQHARRGLLTHRGARSSLARQQQRIRCALLIPCRGAVCTGMEGIATGHRLAFRHQGNPKRYHWGPLLAAPATILQGAPKALPSSQQTPWGLGGNSSLTGNEGRCAT